MTRDPFAQKKKQPPAPASGWSQPAGAVWGDSADEPKADRAEPVSHSYLDNIPTADWHPKKRKKDTRQREKSRWLSLLPENKQRIKKYTDTLNVPEYELVRYLLEYGLEQVANGNLVFESHLDQTGLTLYPNEKRPRKSRKDRSTLVNTAYRGIPDETWDQLKMLARNHPIWQVANKLIEHSLEQLASGRLNPNPQASGIQTLY